ncbi:MAG: helix-turn-helix domain-containing protein [Eubacterium sp.]|nr:helix-turn-helix domain-containing protein [Eubacterium sp.]
MEYLTTSETAERWGITVRRVQVLCKEGRVDGAVYKGIWLIPADAEKPDDPRRLKKQKK